MLITKTRLQGKSVVVTLPSAVENQIGSGAEYVVAYGDGGAITLVPKIENPFMVDQEGIYYEGEV